MRLFAVMMASVLLLASLVAAQNTEMKTEKLVGWMRLVNTLQFEFKMANHRFATGDELVSFAKTGKQTGSAVAVAKELTPSSMAPYTLEITTSPDGGHYLATVKRPSDMRDRSTWCKTAVFSDDTGLIYLGQNIGCSGTDALGASSEPSK